jgi:chorismate mutase/prephenate dehydratase
MNNLQKMREQLDALDSKLVDLFEQRFALSKEVALFKAETGGKVYDKERELRQLSSVRNMVNDKDNEIFIEDLFIHILDLSKKLQYRYVSDGNLFDMDYDIINDIECENVKVVYQGVPGSYSHEAVLKEFGENPDCFNAVTFKDAMDVIQNGQADYAVLPIENSSAGIVNETYDLLYDFDNFIVKETNIRVSHALLGLPEAEITDIKTVYSHPQGLMQCREFLEEHKEWSRIARENTAVCAMKVNEEKDKTQAAIASTTAARLYGLKILQENINFSDLNTTRFIIVSRKKAVRKNANKIMLCFELPHESGSLYRVLSNFIYNKLNMTKIESRPIADKTWEYRFFVEFEGNLRDESVKHAITAVSQEALSFKILGNY